ncbi:MAG TPA: O-antigen ligase family protein, partial [Cystobacter sp.]
MELKSTLFLLVSAVVLYVGCGWVGRASWRKDACVFFLVLGTVHSGLIDINLLSREWYRGTTRGLEWSWLDYLWIFVLVDELKRRRPGTAMPVCLSAMALFVGYNALRVVTSDPWIFGVFELSKMIRATLLFLAVALYVKEERHLRIIVAALAISTSYEFLATVYSRVILGHARADGTLNHPNSLAMYNLMTAPMLFAVYLSDVPRKLRRLCGVAALLGTLSVVMTISRAGFVGILLLLFGVGLTCGFWKNPIRVAVTAAILAVVGTGLYLKLGDAFNSRFETSLAAEYGDKPTEGRIVYLNLADLIVNERPWGCGLNNWSWCVTNRYGPMLGMRYLAYESTDERPRTGPIPAGSNVEAPQAAPAHSLYAITLGESGWLGVILLGLLWWRWLKLGASFLRARSPSFRSRFGTGVFFSLLGVALQSIVEWEIRQTPRLFLLHILLGAVASLYPARPSR